MASIASKFARAAVATCASPSAVRSFAAGGRLSLHPCLPRLYQTGSAIPVSPAAAGGPKSSEQEKVTPKSEVAPHAATKRRPPLFVDENALKSKEAMWAFYEYWCKYHHRSRNRSEMASRFKTFSDTARFVHKFNNSRRDVRVSMNHMADWTKKERSRLLGYRPREK